MQLRIAYHFMEQKDWERALPDAEGAAGCGSAWGLLCLAECYEGMQRWDEAEKYYRAAASAIEQSAGLVSLLPSHRARRHGSGPPIGATIA